MTFHYATDQGRRWQLHPTRMEVSGLNHNVFGGFLSLRVGIYSLQPGSIQLSDFSYQAIDGISWQRKLERPVRPTAGS